MKLTQFGFFILIIILQSCVTEYHYPTYGSISVFPTVPHQNDVQIVYNNQLPERSHFIAGLLSVTKYDAGSLNKRLNLLQKQAQMAGADLIVLEGKEGEKEDLKGIAVKYFDKMDYIEEYPKLEEIYSYDESTDDFELAATVTLNLKGKPIKTTGLQYLPSKIHKFSYSHLVSEQSKHWTYYLDRYDRVTRRILKSGGLIKKELSLYYGDNTQQNAPIKEIQIYHIEDLPRGYGKVQFVYDKSEQMIGKLVSWYNKPIEREIIKYDDKGRMKTREIRRFGRKGKELKYLKVVYSYYTVKDINALRPLKN